MKTVTAVLSAVLLALPALAQHGAKPEAAKPEAGGADASKPGPAKPGSPNPHGAKPDDQKTLYGVGLAIARSLEAFSLSPAELDQVVKGLRDGATGKAKTEIDPALQMAINELATSRSSAREKAAGEPYLAKMSKDPKAKKTPSGAIVIHEKEGTGASPKETDKVKVNYTGTLVDGKVFDSSQGRGPAEFPLNQVIKCWTESVQTMKVGGKAKVVCPAAIAYGDRGAPPRVPGNAVLTFDIELLDIVK